MGYDPFEAKENGDKCAWVGEHLVTGQGPPEPSYGALGDITGNAGETFAVQSLWSNEANSGAGYCAGAGTASPLPNGPWGSAADRTSGLSPPSGEGPLEPRPARSALSSANWLAVRNAASSGFFYGFHAANYLAAGLAVAEAAMALALLPARATPGPPTGEPSARLARPGPGARLS